MERTNQISIVAANSYSTNVTDAVQVSSPAVVVDTLPEVYVAPKKPQWLTTLEWSGYIIVTLLIGVCTFGLVAKWRKRSTKVNDAQPSHVSGINENDDQKDEL